MSFASIDFIVFFIIVLGGTAFIERRFQARTKEIFLLLASYFFYGYWDWRFCFLLLFVTAASYMTAKYTRNRLIYITGIVIPLIVLGFFKYFNFFLSSVSGILGKDIGSLRIILPVGISFYTFQALSYVIDVHRGKIKVENSFVKLALYISFFPQLVAGPIVKASEFLPQLYQDRKVTFSNLEQGVQIMAFGLFKKIVLADHLSVFVDDVYGKPAAFHWLTIFLSVISYSIQIYFDFSGYSDMAIGCAKCLGYDFNKNFNMPYISRNVTEFWNRWHISLSTWLKEYLYIPLGGNRRGTARRFINLILTMLLGGLWHGADWTFVAWGGLHGLALCVDKLLPSRKNYYFTNFLNITVTFLFVSFMWIFFRAESFSNAWVVIKGLFTLQDGIKQPFIWSYISIFIIFAYMALRRFFYIKFEWIGDYYPMLNLHRVSGLTLFFIEIGLILTLAYTGENPFVYFQF